MRSDLHGPTGAAPPHAGPGVADSSLDQLCYMVTARVPNATEQAARLDVGNARYVRLMGYGADLVGTGSSITALRVRIGRRGPFVPLFVGEEITASSGIAEIWIRQNVETGTAYATFVFSNDPGFAIRQHLAMAGAAGSTGHTQARGAYADL